MDLHSARIRQHALEENAGSLEDWNRFAIQVTASLLATQARIVELQRKVVVAVKHGADPASSRKAITELVTQADGLRELKLEIDSKVLELEVLAGRRG